MLDDRPLVWNGKLPRKTLALLERLIERGPGGARDELLMDQLWPDAAGDAARRALATAVFRLRRLLGQDEAVIRTDGTTRLDATRCWVDVWAVDRLLARAQAVSTTGPEYPGRWAAWIERAEVLFGSADETGGAHARHDRLRGRLARELLRLARHWEGAGECAKARRTFERVMSLDPDNQEARAVLSRLDGERRAPR